MPLLIVILGILLLFVLIAKFKLNAFIAFIISSIFVGVFQGMELETIIKSIQTGMGNTLGFFGYDFRVWSNAWKNLLPIVALHKELLQD